MINKCAERIADWLIENHAISIKEREVYVYGTYSLCLSALPLILALIFGLLMRCPARTILVIMPFVLLRKYSGGFHTQNVWTCFTGSSALLILCTKLSFILTHAWAIFILSTVATVSLISLSPIDNEKKRLDATEKRYCRKISLVWSICFLLIIILCLVLKRIEIASCITTGVILSAGLQYPCVICTFLNSRNDQN